MSPFISFDKGFWQAPARHLLPEGALLEALNVVPDETGALITRAGHTPILGPLDQLDVHSLFVAYTRTQTILRYQGAGHTLYRNGSAILGPLSGNRIDFATMRGNNEQTLYTFFANEEETLRVKDNGTTVSKWGIDPPSHAPTVSLNSQVITVIDDFDSNPVSYTGTNVTLTRDTTYFQESTASLQAVVAAGVTGVATDVITAVDLTTFAGGIPSLDDDPILLWIAVDLLANLDRIEIAFNFSSGTQFIDGYYTATIFASDLSQSDNDWSHMALPKTIFAKVGTASGGWAAINGIRLQISANDNGPVTVHFDLMQLIGSVAIGGVSALGSIGGSSYRWRLTHQRKPQPPMLAYGRWTNGTSSFTEQTGGTLDISTLVNNDGHVIGADEVYGEIVYTISGASTGGTPVYEFAYSNGSSWTVFTPTVRPVFTATGLTRLKLNFPTTNWRPMLLTGDTNRHLFYWIRVRATTAPASSAAAASAVRVFDSAAATESNPSEASAAVTTIFQPVGLSNLPDPTNASSVDYDPQVTHLGIYRTTGNQSLEDSPFLFEDDVVAGVTTFTSSMGDPDLGALLLYDNDRPPAFLSIVEHQQRIFGLKGNQVYVSKAQQPEAFPVPLRFDVGTLADPPRRLFAYDGVLYITTVARMYELVGFGNDDSGNPLYIPRELAIPTGLGALRSVTHGTLGIYLYGMDGNYWVLRGTAGAEKLSDKALYQLFHNVAFNGVDPIHGDTTTCVSGWIRSRVYFSYPTLGASVPTATLMFDEKTGTWYRDSRAFRSFFYDRQGNVLYGGMTNGTVVAVDTNTTDAGAAISSLVQARDDDGGQPESDKQLSQLAVEAVAESGQISVAAVVGYGTTSVPLGSVGTLVRGQHLLSPLGTGAAVRGKALGYRLSWTGMHRLYRLFPHVLTFPISRQRYDTLPTDLGYPGEKRIETFFLDIELRSGTLAIDLYADDHILQTLTYTQLGRHQGNLLQTSFDCTVLQFFLRGTGEFLLYPNTYVGWAPLPPTVRTYRSVPTDLGHPGAKVLYDVFRDYEWVAPGTITMTFVTDGIPVYHLQATEALARRKRLPRDRLPSVPFRLLEVEVVSDVPMRLWTGTTIGWKPLGVQQTLQRYTLAEQAVQGTQKTPLVQEAA